MIGQSLLEGKQLYRDLWDNKPPGIFYLYAVIAKVFGRVMWSTAVVEILLLFVISYFIFRFTERYAGSAAAAIAVAVHASWHVQAGYVFMAQPETFQLLFFFLSYFLVARKGRWPNLRVFSGGLSLGMAFWLKYNAIAFLPFLALVPYLDTSALDREPRRAALVLPWRKWLAKAAVLTAGLATAVVGLLAWFWLAGAWPAMREIQFEVMPRYVAMAVQQNPHYWTVVTIVTNYWVGQWTEAATLAALLIAWRFHDLKRFAPIFLAAAAAYASTAMQVRFHNYYFQTCFPFFAIVWGYLCAKIFEGFRAAARSLVQRGWRLATVLVWVVFANLVYWPLPAEASSLAVEYRLLMDWRRDRHAFYAQYPWQLRIEHLRDQLGVIHYLTENSVPGDGVYVWSANALIYFLSDRRPPTRFVSNLGLVSVWTPDAWREELVGDLKKSPPRFIVVARKDWLSSITYTHFDSKDYLKAFPKLNMFIADYYRPVADFDTFLIYRRT
jgi:hypothetical protein